MNKDKLSIVLSPILADPEDVTKALFRKPVIQEPESKPTKVEKGKA